MIKWITNKLAIAPKGEADESLYKIVDVRDMLDKKGNPPRLILEKIEAVVEFIKDRQKVVICCDYGLSRSNAIAVGVLIKYFNYNFDEAVRIVLKKTGQGLIELGLLNSVKRALGIVDKKSKNKKTILITGADGFIGSALCDLLKDRYYLITPKNSEVDLIRGPIELDLLVKKSNPSIIIHLADPKIHNTNQSMSEIISMLKNVLDVCRENKISIIFPSSWEVFSGYKGKLITAKSSLCPKPGDTYGQAKFICEILLNQYKENYGVNVAILRFSSVYGPGGRGLRFILDFVEKAKKNLPIYTHKYKNGFPIVDLLHIKDAVLAIESVIKKEFFGAVNIGGGIGLSTFEIAEKIKELLNSKSEIFLRKMDDCTPRIIMNTKEAKKFLGWSPKTTLDEGIGEIINNINKY